MKNTQLLLSVALLFVAGCGKKHHAPTTVQTASSATESSKVVATKAKPSDSSIPLYSDETESFLDEETEQIPEFAFLDEQELQATDQTLANNDVVIDGDIEAELLKEVQSSDVNESFQTVYFDFNKNNVRKDQEVVVKANCQVAKNAVEKKHTVVVEGHCDQVGSAAYNMALSQQRAQTIKQEMVKEGVASNKIKTLGYGFERPVVWSTQKDRDALVKELAPNRRAEILVE